jgi:hypothetical protein
MKKILIILTLITALIACKNQNVEFPDFNYTAGYFPYQYPVRTLILGHDYTDNTNDNNHKFLISVAFGGVYENKENRIFNIEVLPSLCNNVLFNTTHDTIRLMPPTYYTLSSNQITIPAGKVNAGVEVQLTEAFFNDPLALKLAYVIPVRIVNATGVDSILVGKVNEGLTNPDRRETTDWSVQPKDFTMFAVNYINPFHGNYLHRGTNIVKDASAKILETNVYHSYYIERNEIWSLVNNSKTSVTVTGSTHSVLGPTSLSMNLTFADDSTCTINQVTGSPYTITGNGKFISNADSWGDKPRDAIFISYIITNGTNTVSAIDTLTARDRGVAMQLYSPIIYAK